MYILRTIPLLLITLLISLPSTAYATCAETFSGSHIWRCPDTGNPTTNGTDLADFIHAKPFSCGDRIILDAGVVYRGLEYVPSDPLIRIHHQTGCAGKLTSLESSRLFEIPYNQKENLANYRSYMPTIEVGTNSIFQLMPDVGGSNNYAFRGLRLATSAYTVANRYRIASLGFGTGGFRWNTPGNLELYSPHDFEFDRVIMEDYEQGVYGYPTISATDPNTFLRSVSLGIDGPFQNLYIHDSYFVFDGYSNNGGNAVNTDWISITNATAANPSVIQGTTLTTTLGITYAAGCVTGCDGFDDGGACGGACKRVVVRGGTGSWAALNGPRYLRARADGNVDVFTPNPDSPPGATAFDGTGLGAFTATSPQISGVAGLVQYAISATQTASNWRIIDNFVESWAMPVWFGGADGPPIDPAVIQSGSTATSLVLSHVRGLAVGDMVTFSVPAGSGPSDYCYRGPGSSGCGEVDTFRVGRTTAITGNTVTVEAWGVDGTDGTTPETGGQAVWNTWKVQGIQVRGNAISRGYLQSNAAVGKGVSEMKKCENCLVDGNAMGGYLDSTNTMRGNVGGTYFMEAINQGGWDPNHTIFNVRWSNNLGSGQLGSGTASCLWNNTMIGNYYHYHSAKGAERQFYEHNIATGCLAISYTQTTHINTIVARNSSFKHNTFAPDMAQVYNYQFERNTECEPTGTSGFPFFPAIAMNLNVSIKDNIIGYGGGALRGTPNDATCWPTIGQDIRTNIIVDTQSIGTSTINSEFPNNLPVADYTNFWAGTCVFTSWTNCSLKSTNPNRGAATDGGDPGADIEQVQDRLHRWSERAGLIETDILAANMTLRLGSWRLGSTVAAVTFNLFNSYPSSGCTVQLFTNRNRSTADADSPTAQFCNRTGSVVGSSTVSYVFGGGVALSPNTTYFYRIVDGSRTMVGEFTTLPTGSGATVFTYSYPTARTGNVCTNAAMTTSCSSISSSTAHTISVPQGELRYYQPALGTVTPLPAR